MMIKEVTTTYQETFWTSPKCPKCFTSFTPKDYQTQNYQLSFPSSLTTFPLTHRQCPFNCLICSNLLHQKWLKKEKSIP